MYQRSFTEGTSALPEGYSGSLFKEAAEENIPDEAPAEAVTAEPKRECKDSPLSHLPLGNLFSEGGLKLPHIGTEEILIIIAAGFLFFSADADKISALMLLALLFV